jgi:hypothetical protein
MTLIERAETALAEYCDAYEAANGYRPSGIRYERGWVRLKFGQNVRLPQLAEYTARLRDRAALKA